MGNDEKAPLGAEQDPDDDVTVDPPDTSTTSPHEEPPSQPDGYGSGV